MNRREKSEELEGGFYEIPPWQVILLSMGLAIILTITGIWQLVLVAGFIAGFLPKNLKGSRGFLVAFIGGFLAWISLFSFYFLTTEMMIFVDRVFVEIMGLSRIFIPLIFILCALFGGVFCGFGGLNGVLASRLVKRRLEIRNETVSWT